MKELLHKLIKTSKEAWFTLPIRFGLGIVFIAHGAQKLFGWFGGGGLEGTGKFFAAKLGMEPGILWAFLAGAGEFFGGLLVLLGLLTRFGALNIAITMMVAIAMVHPHAFFAKNGGMEFPLTLLLAAVALIISGGGPLSVDNTLQDKLEE